MKKGIFTPKKNTKIGKVRLGKYYIVRFSLKVDGSGPSWESLVHVGNVNGHRVPAIWLYANSKWKLHVRTSTNKSWNNGCNASLDSVEKNKWFEVVVRTNKKQMWVRIANKIICSTKWKDGETPMDHGEQTVWGADPWSPSRGQIRDLTMYSNDGKRRRRLKILKSKDQDEVVETNTGDEGEKKEERNLRMFKALGDN